ncbi:MAG: ExeM/NucH family extracellular endonuclease [Gemmatimonadetes bacterium]|nr:ExeM/NucH family extracellular endonuclease [Gemmatimonadota bacterium]
MTLPGPHGTRRRPLATTILAAALLSGCGGDPTAASPRAVAPLTERVASASGVVINQVYGGGGNSGATLTHDFIELYNASSAAVALTGWSVQYASSSGTSWQITPLSGSIAAGGYYLVRQAQGTGGTTPLPTPDAIGSIAMSASSGKVALVTSTTALTGNGCPIAAPIEDYVGYGTSANCFEGSAPTANLSNTTAAVRSNLAALDTDQNGTDFTVAAPTPRNGAAGPPTVASTVPVSAATDVAVNANLSVTFSKPVTVTGTWFTIDCTTSGAHTATVSGGPATYTLDPDADLAASESCTATILAAQVADASNPALTLPADYAWSFTTLGGNVCSLPYTPAFDIQGSGTDTPLDGQVVSTQGVVIGDYEGASPTLRGFYVQDANGDGDPATSDGIFVFNGNADNVALGDVVRVTGTAQEFQGQTQLGTVTSVIVCSTGASVPPTDVSLPFASTTSAERYEGMLVRLPQTLYVTEHFQLGRFGQVTMSAGGRLFQPTHLAAPGAPALALQAQNDLNRIIVDDADNNQNADPIVFGRGGLPLSASNTLRGGDAAAGIVGVLTYTWAGNSASGNAYRVRPVGALGGAIPAFTPMNARPPAPANVGGSLKVGAMNVLNYFNTFSGCTQGVGGSATSCRGAEDAFEFTRQAQKTVASILALDADVLGLVEIENDGYGAPSAIADLVNQLNAVAGAGTWALVDVDAATGQLNALGTDAIKVGLIYKPASVTPVGATAVLNSVAFVNGGDLSPRNRPALAQAFRQANNASFVAVVNHFKSKGSACDAPDAGDGQGECSIVRTNAAVELRNWLATDPTGTADPDVLVLGDLNSYAKEDAITTLTSGGFTNLIEARQGTGAYSFVFDGQWGYLDHALASSTLASQVTGVTEWHNNADEPSVLDYNTNFKSPGQVSSLFAADPYRSADHDPVLVGLNLLPGNRAPSVSVGGPYSANEGAPILLSATGSDPDGDLLSYLWDFGDGSTGSGASPSHAFPDNGSYAVAVTVTDGRGGSATASTTVTVSNVAPSAAIVSPAGGTVSQGSFALALGNILEPSPIDAASLQYRFNCGTGFGAIISTPSTTCTILAPGTATLRGALRDKDGAVQTYTKVVTVVNAPPQVTILSPTSVTIPVGGTVTFSASFVDPGTGDNPWTARVRWAAGQAIIPLGAVSPATPFGASQVYATAGTFTAQVEVEDKYGARQRRSFTVIVQ